MARLLARRGDAVAVTALSAASIASLRNDGFDARRLDLDLPETFSVLDDAHTVLLCPAPSDPSDDGHRRVYGEGVPRLAAALAARPSLPRVVYTSSTAVYGDAAAGLVDETSPVDPSQPRAAAILVGEKAVLAPPLRGIVLRLGGLYGPERNRLAALESGTLPPARPDDIANLIHVDDAAAAAVLLLDRGLPGQIYLGVDDAPTPRAQMYAWLAEQAGVTPPAGTADPGPRRGGPKRCSNRKLVALGFAFRFPTFRDGYRDLLAARPR